MNHIYFFLYLIITSGMFSLLEIQAEGQDGWAGKFPTWKIENKWTKTLFGGRPLTGYHLYFFLFMVCIVHLPFGLNFLAPSWVSELRILSFFIFFFIVEDFLWFVMNPAYGINKFNKTSVWWHAPQWLGFMPRDYWIFIPLATALYIWSYML